ncbi:hypothetical protein SAMN05216262_10674 [Colwellia chukchiensis]|uniref:Uncharacterized protein n=1 Tax=Colwellia chukchiensis TaxID=641665 RepID=A0A1H7MNP7_9GAMM|nr:hypothetical protein [Colwellia chukchiensis]SEL12823.1 hypothetical protein SAMN05216262_10674 [Colwellia chukchiensis]
MIFNEKKMQQLTTLNKPSQAEESPVCKNSVIIAEIKTSDALDNALYAKTLEQDVELCFVLGYN